MKPIPKPNPNKVLIEDHCQKIETAMLPDEARQEAERELARLVGNEPDLDDLTDDRRQELHFVLADTIDAVLNTAELRQGEERLGRSFTPLCIVKWSAFPAA